MELRFRVLRGTQTAPRATLANARPSEDPGKLSSSALAWRRRQCVNRGGPPMPQRAWREDIRATRAKTFLESCLKLKGFREEARAWVVGGARCFALAAATRWRLQRVPQRRSLPSSIACARRVDGSAPRGSARRSTWARKRRAQRLQATVRALHSALHLVIAEFQASCSFKAFCSPGFPGKLLGRRAQKAAGRRFRFLAATSSSLQRATKRFPRRFHEYPLSSVLKIRPEASCHGVHARSPTCARDQFTRARGGVRPFRSPDLGFAHDSCGIRARSAGASGIRMHTFGKLRQAVLEDLPSEPRSRQRTVTSFRCGANCAGW